MKNNDVNASLNILVVQNEAAVNKRIYEILLAAGYKHVVFVDCVRSALDVLRTQPIETLICNIDLQELDGWRLSRLVRSGVLRCHSKIPILLTMSTWCERIAEVTAREYGVNDLVSTDNLNELPAKLAPCLDIGYRQAKPRVLVVEDEEDTANLIASILKQRFDVEVASDGRAGLYAWLERQHDLILLDVMLPELSGPEVLDEIMAIKPNQPVVIMTAHAPVEQAEELLIKGAADFIRKPFRPDALRSICEVAFRRDDYMVSNQQFAARVKSLSERESAYRKVSEAHKHLLNSLQTVVMELDDAFNITFLNDAWERMLGFEVKDSTNKPLKQFLSAAEVINYRGIEARLKTVLLGREASCEIEVMLDDVVGQKRWAKLIVTRLISENKPDAKLSICLDDITHHKKDQQRLEYLAMHDSLTGLYNRHYLEKYLINLSADAISNPQTHGLIYLDLDHFKVINDTFGHHRGDNVLRQVSRLINDRIRESDIVCRFGGDEFVIILNHLDANKTVQMAENIKNAISEHAFTIEKYVRSLACSIGISFIDGSTSDSNLYLMQADTALFEAKRRGRNAVHVFNPNDGASDELRDNLDWSRYVRQAITEDRMTLHFQPIVKISTRETVYYEALVRMIDQDGSLVMPDKFIPALESTGEMALLDRWVIKHAIALLSQSPLLKKIAINLSAQAFKDKALVSIITDALSANNVAAEAITFELTESASLLDIVETNKVISELHQLGCSFAIDDFGSGFSSFAYLKELPADYIKLDGSFIRNLHKDKVDRALVHSIIKVVKALGRQTVAEFVENEEILTFLEQNGVDYAQGYHLGKPMPIESIVEQSAAVKSITAKGIEAKK
jgi:diguanylate cyclase (GGDEF)-like protein/PAS domain S-box-containing protein